MSSAQAMQLFCLSDPDYYEAPDRLDDAATRYWLDGEAEPPGWRRARRGLWTEFRPGGLRLPDQGWKIHLSASPDWAETALAAAAAACVPRRVTFKFLRSRDALLIINGKYAPRGSSGKFVTIYPSDERLFGELLDALVSELDGNPGPYILSDLRIGRGPVFVRYGAFTEQWCVGPDGARVPALRDPGGILVPDERGPVFRAPAWVEPPAGLRPHLAARAAATLGDFPYRVVRPLYFTNAGGTYLAEHRDGGPRVVLREARPHAGLDGAGDDAVARMDREYAALTTLDGLDCVPTVYGRHTVWEHEFLVEEYVEGKTVLRCIVNRHPLRLRDPSAATIRGYLAWVDTIVSGLAAALAALHERGVSFGDLHPGNVIVRPDDSVVLIDFEYAGAADATDNLRVGAPGFTPPSDLTGAEADRYALRAMWLMMLLPVAELAERHPSKAATVEAVARELFDLPTDAGPPWPARCVPADGAGGDAGAALFGAPDVDWPSIRDGLVAGVLRSATPDRTDRLFPADPRVFDGPGADLAHGAAGVLLALHHAGVPVPPAYVDWLTAAARRGPARPGLFGGLHGVATVLHDLGRVDEAFEVLRRAEDAEVTGPDLYAGLTGVALCHGHLGAATDDRSLDDRAVRTARRLGTGSDGADPETAAGLLHGAAGIALLQIQAYRLTGDSGFLSAARRALARDLDRCVRLDDGTVQVRSGPRHLLYIDGGSGGIALAAAEYLAHRDDAELVDLVDAVRHGCGNPLVREPGLFQGRVGLLAVLARLSEPGPDETVRAQVRRLGWHAVARDGALLIPGRRLRRFSADLATGSAGVLLALHSVFDGGGDLLARLLPGLLQPTAVRAT
jgi:hypothetical protein